MQKIPLLLFHEWISGVGEQTAALHGFLRIADFIKETFPEKFHIIYRIWVGGSDPGQNEHAILNGLNIPLLKTYVDDVEIIGGDGQQRIFFLWQDESEYRSIAPGYPTIQSHCGQEWLKAVFIKTEHYSEEIASTIRQFIIDEIDIHPLLQGQTNSFGVSRISVNPKEVYSQLLIDMADKVCLENSANDFETVHCRIHNQPGPWEKMKNEHFYWWTEEEERELILPIIETLSNHMNDHTKYFISSNSNILKYELRARNPNTFFIDRGDTVPSNRASVYKKANKSLQRYYQPPMGLFDAKIPSIIPPGIFDANEDLQVVHEFLAMLEVVIMSRGKRITHIIDCGNYRDMISLFLWYPLVVKSIPLTWITCYGEIMDVVYNGYGVLTINRR